MKNIYWYAPDEVFTAFKDRLDNPSFRLRCWHIHQRLLKDGYNSKVVSNIKDIRNPDIVTLMSFGEEEYDLANWVKFKRGGHVLHDFCEDIVGIPILEATKKLCSLIVCCSTHLAKEQSSQYGFKAVVVRDPYEVFPVKHNIESDPKILKVGWSGMSDNALFDEILKPVVANLGMEYVEISNRPESNHLWERDSWYHHLASCDICLCPQPHWRAMGKSNVKVTTAMSLGLPVLASPIPSYQEIIVDNVNGYICPNIEDWEVNLRKLQNKNKRKDIVKEYEKSLLPYSSENIYLDWLVHVKRACNFRR